MATLRGLLPIAAVHACDVEVEVLRVSDRLGMCVVAYKIEVTL